MLTNKNAKLINSLSKKKFRQKYNKFVVEGIKIIEEVLKSHIKVEKIYAVDYFFREFENITEIISVDELKKISRLINLETALAVCSIPEEKPIKTNGLILALDDVRDPGNLGTLIRLADWFGIEQVICSHETVDLYNPKVIQSTMGSFTRVQVNYTDLNNFLTNFNLPVLGTFMDGKNIYRTSLPKEGILLMGNESNGISKDLEKFITHRVGIPRTGKFRETESLNVSMAAGIILGELTSQNFRNL